MELPLKSQCPQCGQALKVSDASVGRTVRCPACAATFEVTSVQVSNGRSMESLPEACHTVADEKASRNEERLKTSKRPDARRRRLGRFELIELLGQGGFGRVYRAYDPQLDRLVAVKVPTFSLQDAERLQRFVTEARAAARLRHPHIVTTYESGTLDGHPFIAAQFVTGDPLSVKLKKATPGFRQAAEWTYRLAEALAYAHREGIIHRDVKPDNIMIDEQGLPQIMDFGLAKRINEEAALTVDGSVLGTPAYMAPEHARGESSQVGPASDQYSLGVVLYEMLTGKKPFNGPPHAVIAQVLATEPASPLQLRPGVPADLAAICQKAMSKEPTRRYPSLTAMAEDLARFLRGEPTVARPLSVAERSWRWCRRNRTVAALVATAVFLLLAGTISSTSLAIRARRGERLAKEQTELARQQAALAKQQTELAKQQTELATEQRDAAVRARQEADDARKATAAALQDARRQTALLTFERAASLCEQGEISRGMLLLVRALKIAEQAEDADLKDAVRLNLAAWSREIHRPMRMLSHPQSVDYVAYSPDGKTLATGCRDGVVRLWNPETGKPLGFELVHPWPVRVIAFHPKEPLLLTGCDDGHARTWSLADGKPVGSDIVHFTPSELPSTAWHKRTGVSCLAYSPDGETIITGGWDNRLKFWDAATGNPHGSPNEIVFSATSIRFSPDGASFAASSPNRVIQFWNWSDRAKKGEAISTGGWTLNVAIHPSGTKVLGSLLQTNDAGQWDVQSGRRVAPPLKHLNSVFYADHSPDGKWIATASVDGTARLWDAERNRPKGSPLSHPATVMMATFAPDGRTLATGCEDNVLRIWEPSPGSVAASFDGRRIPARWIRGAALSPNGQKLVLTVPHESDSPPNVWVYDVASGSVEHKFTTIQWGQGAAFSADGAKVYVADAQQEAIRVFDLIRGEAAGSTDSLGAELWRLAISPDGTRLLTGSNDSRARLWDAASLQPVGKPLEHESGHVFGIAFSPDGQTVMTGGHDHTTRLWNAKTGERIGDPKQHPVEIWSLAFHPGGRIVATGGSDRAARLWNLEDWRPSGLPMPHDGDVSCLSFSPNGEFLVTGSRDNTGRVWHVASCKPVGPVLRHHGPLNVVQCSHDGTLVLTAGDDGFAKLWHLPTAANGSVEQIAAWVERLTAMTMDDQGAIHPLTAEQWQQAMQCLIFDGPQAGHGQTRPLGSGGPT